MERRRPLRCHVFLSRPFVRTTQPVDSALDASCFQEFTGRATEPQISPMLTHPTPVFHFLPFSPVFMGLDCSGSDIVDSYPVLTQKFMKNTERKYSLTFFNNVKENNICKVQDPILAWFRILFYFMQCVSVFSVSSTLSLCQFPPQRQIVYLECRGAYVKTSDALIIRFSLC